MINKSNGAQQSLEFVSLIKSAKSKQEIETFTNEDREICPLLDDIAKSLNYVIRFRAKKMSQDELKIHQDNIYSNLVKALIQLRQSKTKPNANFVNKLNKLGRVLNRNQEPNLLKLYTILKSRLSLEDMTKLFSSIQSNNTKRTKENIEQTLLIATRITNKEQLKNALGSYMKLREQEQFFWLLSEMGLIDRAVKDSSPESLAEILSNLSEIKESGDIHFESINFVIRILRNTKTENLVQVSRLLKDSSITSIPNEAYQVLNSRFHGEGLEFLNLINDRRANLMSEDTQSVLFAILNARPDLKLQDLSRLIDKFKHLEVSHELALQLRHRISNSPSFIKELLNFDLKESYGKVTSLNDIFYLSLAHKSGDELKRISNFIKKASKTRLKSYFIDRVINSCKSDGKFYFSRILDPDNNPDKVSAALIKTILRCPDDLLGEIHKIFDPYIDKPEGMDEVLSFIDKPSIEKFSELARDNTPDKMNLYLFLDGANSDDLEQLSKILKILVDNQTIDSYKSNFIQQYLHTGNRLVTDLQEHMEEIIIQSAVVNLIQGLDSSNIDNVKRVIYGNPNPGFYTNEASLNLGEPAVDRSNASYNKVKEEALKVMSRVFDTHFGFSTMAFESRRNPNKDEALLLKFGRDIGKELFHINASSPMKFPGKGFMIKGIDLPAMMGFEKDIDRKAHEKEISEMLDSYKASLPWLQDSFRDSENTNYIFLRGMIAVIPPDSDDYTLKGRRGEKLHYSYVVYNDHFKNDGRASAYLVPSKVLLNTVKESLIEDSDYRGFNKSLPDINKQHLDIKSLISRCEAKNQNVLNLGWGSNLAGLNNAFPPNQKPYHDFEGELDHPRDFYGHLKIRQKDLKSNVNHGTRAKISEANRAYLLDAHRSVYRVTTKLQDLLQVSQLAMAQKHKGFSHSSTSPTLNTREDEFNLPGESFEGAIPEDTEKEKLFLDAENLDTMDLRDNKDAKSMLYEIYNWRNSIIESFLSQGKTPKINDFPVLALVDTFNWSEYKESPVILDSYDMSLTLTSKFGEVRKYKFDSKKPGEKEEFYWFTKVMPEALATDKDLRLYHRLDIANSRRKENENNT